MSLVFFTVGFPLRVMRMLTLMSCIGKWGVGEEGNYSVQWVADSVIVQWNPIMVLFILGWAAFTKAWRHLVWISNVLYAPLIDCHWLWYHFSLEMGVSFTWNWCCLLAERDSEFDSKCCVGSCHVPTKNPYFV